MSHKQFWNTSISNRVLPYIFHGYMYDCFSSFGLKSGALPSSLKSRKGGGGGGRVLYERYRDACQKKS